MKQFLKVVIGIVVLAGILVGVYFVLPEYPQNVVKSIIQPMTDANAKTMIEKVKMIPNKDLDNLSYQTILEAKTKNACWVYETREEEPGIQYVIFYGRGASINLKAWTDYNGMLSTSAVVKVEFKIRDNNVDILPYVDGKLMRIEDGQHVEQNDKIRLAIFSQMYNGMTDE